MYSRRQILQTVSAGFGYLAFSGISSLQSGKRAFGSEEASRHEFRCHPRHHISLLEPNG